MDSVWKTLPTDLVNHVCNQLPKVRRIDENLKGEIETRNLNRLKWHYIGMFGFNFGVGFLIDDLDRYSEHSDEYEAWYAKTPCERMEFYRSVFF